MLETTIIYNPITCLFLSYIIGAALTAILNKTGHLKNYSNPNYISDSLTKKIGVIQLRWLIRNTPIGKFNTELKLKGKFSLEKIQHLFDKMTFSEVGHLIGFIFLLFVNVFLFFWGVSYFYLIVFFIINVIFNLYLVFLQQFNKRRIQKIMARMN